MRICSKFKTLSNYQLLNRNIIKFWLKFSLILVSFSVIHFSNLRLFATMYWERDLPKASLYFLWFLITPRTRWWVRPQNKSCPHDFKYFERPNWMFWWPQNYFDHSYHKNKWSFSSMGIMEWRYGIQFILHAHRFTDHQ